MQTTVLVVGTAAVAGSSLMILWRELSPDVETRFMRSWRDYAGSALTFAGVAVVLWLLWASR